VSGEDGYPELLSEDADGGLQVDIHAKLRGKRRRLIDGPFPRAPDADLLQGHDIGPAGGDPVGHAAKRNPNNEPFQTLVKLHGAGDMPLFGQNVVQFATSGSLSVGDLITVTRRGNSAMDKLHRLKIVEDQAKAAKAKEEAAKEAKESKPKPSQGKTKA